MIKTFICGLCKQKDKEIRTNREGLRKHLREEHFIKNEIANSCGHTDTGIVMKRSNKEKVRKNWWITEGGE